MPEPKDFKRIAHSQIILKTKTLRQNPICHQGSSPHGSGNSFKYSDWEGKCPKFYHFEFQTVYHVQYHC